MDTSEIENGLYLHLGAHRTGTSSFQAFLGRNRQKLEDFGIKALYPGRDGAKGGRLRLRSPGRKHFRTEALARYEGWLKEEMDKHGVRFPCPLLISEENITGTLATSLRKEIYEGAGLRVEFLKDQLQQPVRRVMFTVRSYETFFVSAYLKRLEENALGPFSDYAAAVAALRKPWTALVEELRDAAKADEFIVRVHEDRMAPRDQLQLLFPELPNTGWNALRWVVNASKSQDELAQMQVELWEKMNDRPFPGFGEIAFDDEQTKRFQARYAADLKEISAMKGVTLVR